jgi:hypothetical protein
MRKELFEFVVLLVTMIKMENSQPQWLPTKGDFLFKIVNPKQTKDTVANTVADSFIYTPCGLSESGNSDYHLVFE